MANIPPGAGSPPSGGGGTPPPPDNIPYQEWLKTIRDIHSATADVASSVQGLNDTMGRMPGIAEDVGKKFSKVGLEMRGIVALADTAHEAMKEMSGYVKTLTKSLSSTDSLKNAKATLQGIVEASERLLQRGFLSEKDQKRVQTQIAHAKQMMEQFGKTAATSLDAGQHEGLLRFLKEVTREGERAAEVFRHIKMDSFSKSIVEAKKSLVDSGILKVGSLEKWVSYGETALKLKDARKAKQQENKAVFQRKREEAQASLLNDPRFANVASKLPRTAEGDIDWASAAAKKATLKTMGLGDEHVATILKGEAGGGGAKARVAYEMLMGGQGEAGTGLIKKLASSGLMEGALGEGAELIGKAAVPLAIIETLRKVIGGVLDKSAEMNKQAETAIGGGGIFTGTGTGWQNFDKLKDTLTPNGMGMLYNRLGINYDRNLKMAQAMVSSGYNVEELTNLSSPRYRSQLLPRGEENMMGPGTFGQVQSIAAVQGRILGMGDAQAVEQIMKLLMEYRKSMEGTQEFFINLEKDTRAAGLSTAKYISILEGVTDQFDRMNKSIDQVGDVMRSLSRTGRMTADDLQASMKLIFGPQERDITQDAFLMNEIKTTGQAPEFARRERGTFNAAAKNAYQALSDLGVEGITQSNVSNRLTTSDGKQELDTLLTRFKVAHPDVDLKKITNTQAAINQAYSAAQGLNIANDLAQGNINPMDAVAKLNAKAMSPQERASLQEAGLRAMFSRMGVSGEQIFDKGPEAVNMGLLQMMTRFHYDPTTARDLQQILQTGAQTRLEVGLEQAKEHPEAANTLYNALVDKLGPGAARQTITDKAGKVSTESTYDALNRWSMPGSPQFGKLMMQLKKMAAFTGDDIFDMQSDLAQGMTDKQLKNQQTIDFEKARSLGSATQTTADIFAAAFAHLFNEIFVVVEDIRGILNHHFFGVDEDEEQKASDIFDPKTAARLDEIEKKLATRIEHYKEQLNAQAGDPKRPQLVQERDVEAAQDAYDRIDRYHEFKKGSGLGLDDARKTINDATQSLKDYDTPLIEFFKQPEHTIPMTMGPQGTNGMGFSLTDDQFKQFQDQIEVFAGKDYKDTTSKDAQGHTHHFIQTTNNYYDANFSQLNTAQQRITQTEDSIPAATSPSGPRPR